VPYGHGFDADPCLAFNTGDTVELVGDASGLTLRVVERASS